MLIIKNKYIIPIRDAGILKGGFQVMQVDWII